MSSNIRPWHLPALDEPRARPERRGRTPAGREFVVPALDGNAARRVAEEVRRSALAARRERSVRDVVSAASRAALRLADPDGRAGRRAAELLVEELGWTGQLARSTLAGMASVWREDALLATLREELGDLEVLDGWVETAPPPGRRPAGERSAPVGPERRARDRPDGCGPGGGRSRRRRAAGPPLMLVVHAGNVPGVSVTAALRGLVARSGVLSKTAASEPGLLGLFARELGRVDPLLGGCLAATWWPGGESAPEEEVWLRHAGATVVYGGNEAVEAYRRRVSTEARLIEYGPKVGLGVVLPDAAANATGASALAADVCAYEQAGCVSPRVVYVLGDDPGAWAGALADGLARETERTPPPDPTPEEATTIRSVRAEAEFLGYAREDGEPAVLADRDGLAWTVLVGGDPAPSTRGLPRVVRVHGVSGLSAVERLLGPLEGRIQAIGYAGRQGRAELADLAHRLGVPRLAPFGQVAWPPADWRHDGRHQILPLLRWTDWEN